MSSFFTIFLNSPPLNVALPRRQFLKVTGATAAGTAFFGLTTIPAWAHSAQVLTSSPEFGVSVSAFPLSQVSLLAGPFQNNMNRTLAYLSFIDADRLLYTFRTNVGLSTQGLHPVVGGKLLVCNRVGTL